MTKLYVIGKKYGERGREGFFETLDNEHDVPIPDIEEFERVYLPVICKGCRTPNLIIAEDIVSRKEEERGMGEEVAYYGQAYDKCISCNKDMDAEITLWEYSKGIFKDFNVDEKGNCKRTEIGNLDSLIKDIILAREYREE